MRLDLVIGGHARAVEIVREGRHLRVTLDGRSWTVDARQMDERTWFLRLPDDGISREVGISEGTRGSLVVHVGADAVAIQPRARSRGRGAERGETGPQEVVAPMPGKIVRVLVRPGDAVVARQGVVVVEAMKMENELRATKPGTVRDVFVREGVSVEAGAPLVVIT
jgi:biotin carboxyl carrier protein